MGSGKVLCYIPLDHPGAKRLGEAVASVVPPFQTIVVHSSEGLKGRLREPRNGLKVAVILAGDPRQLENLLALEEMLEDLRIILVLPDFQPETLARGHRLRPRYSTAATGDFEALAAVLKKILAEDRPASRGVTA